MARFALARFVVLSALALLPAVAFGGSVYLNGVNIDGVSGVKFEKATVRIDENGNVFIDAPGYKVVQSPATAAAPPAQTNPASTTTPPPPPVTETPRPSRITKRYWLVVRQTEPGMTEYDVDVYLNAKWLMQVKNGMRDDAIDITRHLLPGANTVVFEARKSIAGARKSYSPEHSMTLHIGEGNEGGGNVMIDNALVTFRRTAQDSESVAQEFTFNTR